MLNPSIVHAYFAFYAIGWLVYVVLQDKILRNPQMLAPFSVTIFSFWPVIFALDVFSGRFVHPSRRNWVWGIKKLCFNGAGWCFAIIMLPGMLTLGIALMLMKAIIIVFCEQRNLY